MINKTVLAKLILSGQEWSKGLRLSDRLFLLSLQYDRLQVSQIPFDQELTVRGNFSIVPRHEPGDRSGRLNLPKERHQ